MKFCELHKEQCEDDKIVNIIEFKKGKIKETNICLDCLCKYIDSPEIFEKDINDIKSLIYKNECPKCGMSEKELKTSKLICENCLSYFKIIKKEDKLNLFENKIAAAIETENYESAAIFKKEIERIKNS